MKFVKVWKDSRPERGEDMMEVKEEEEVLEETEDWDLMLRPCEGSFICADESEVLKRLLKDAAGSAA